jgi:hypothetical protein
MKKWYACNENVAVGHHAAFLYMEQSIASARLWVSIDSSVFTQMRDYFNAAYQSYE